ncbi:FRG domain-containing protein [Photobacterium sanguinicancri]|uniref:FRG domain-containing protein n=1 Tax=Photobacterium sanguinicancri TaxID=875932 RepID=UPI0007880225|nr:FRG domain-containing protein [Photobacterium sanguinicancri]KXI24615.1 hypothetical protein AS132_01340 [Photobacterium sanguinicancri]
MPNVHRNTDRLKFKWRETIKGDELIFSELRILENFMSYCDRLGLPIINDSTELRSLHINSQTADRYYINPSEWPNPKAIELMALAQHHGVPTRLLDWSKRSFVAAYFAATTAISNKNEWKNDSKLAIWALNIDSLALYPNISLVKVPGSTSAHLAAQAGVFTLCRQSACRNEDFSPTPLEDEFKNVPETPLLKITLPVTEATELFRLCKLYDITAASLFPSFDGAAKAVMDDLSL